MSVPVSYWLADVEGVLCVAVRQADWNEPRHCIDYWPTKVRVSTFLAHYELKPEDLRSVLVTQAIPGSYYYRLPYPGLSYYRDRSNYLDLVEGAKTKSIKREYVEIARPRVGKGTKVEWTSGHWYIVPPKGKPRHVYV